MVFKFRGVFSSLRVDSSDKVLEARNHDGVYHLAMKNRRWGGEVLAAAASVEELERRMVAAESGGKYRLARIDPMWL